MPAGSPPLAQRCREPRRRSTAGAAQGASGRRPTAGRRHRTPLTDGQDLARHRRARGRSTRTPDVVYAGTGRSRISPATATSASALHEDDGRRSEPGPSIGPPRSEFTSIAKIVVHPTIPTTLWVANSGFGAGGFSCYGGVFGSLRRAWRCTDGGIELDAGSQERPSAGMVHRGRSRSLAVADRIRACSTRPPMGAGSGRRSTAGRRGTSSGWRPPHDRHVRAVGHRRPPACPGGAHARDPPSGPATAPSSGRIEPPTSLAGV